MINSISMLVRASKRPGRLALVIIVACLVLAGSSIAAPPAPVFKITQATAPTNLVPGSDAPSEAVAGGNKKSATANKPLPQYSVTVTNLGGAATSGEVTVVDTLPAGVAPARPPAAVPSFRVEGEFHPCTVAGQTVTCIVPETLLPSGSIEVSIPVDVASDAPASVTNEVRASGGGAVEASGSISTTVSASPAVFGFLPGEQGFSVNAVDADGTAMTQAGAHPFILTFDAAFPSQQLIAHQEEFGTPIWGAGTLRDLLFGLPKGVVVNPNATPARCTAAQLASSENPKGGGCPPASEIGEVHLLTNLSGVDTVSFELYNMVPAPGVPAEFAFVLAGTFVHVRGGLNGDFTISGTATEIIAKIAAFGVQVVLWGDPSSSVFELARKGAGCLESYVPCPVISSPTAFLTMPSACSGPLSMGVSADSWEQPGTFLNRTAVTTDLNGNPVGISGCSKLAFEPTIAVRPESHAADSPTGLAVDLKLPQSEGNDSLATANLKKAVVQLPAGIAVNPSAADGLAGCSPAEIGIGGNESPSCPDPSKIGEVELVTPLLAIPLQGSVYLAEQDHNPFGSLLVVYLVAEGQGVVIKLAGRVEPDPTTGQLTATFSENPDLPFSDLKVHFDGGPRATLSTPPACGSYESTSALSPWSAADPEHPTAAETSTSSDPFQVTAGPGGGSCANPASLPFAPGFQAGVVTPAAGASSSFAVQLTRQDGEQNISAISTVLPSGLLAKLAGVPLCPESQAASGECPAASQVGETTIGVGWGPTPLYVPQTGKAPTAVYLAGPYKGAPYSLVIKVPAQAGPFDLGTVTVRAAIHIDPHDAHVTVISDPLPQILQGIPLRYRDIRVTINRPGFMLNPTSCEPMVVTGTAGSSGGASASLSSRFQVGDCANLPFKPSFQASTLAKTSKASGASLSVIVASTAGQANIAKVHVVVPKQLPARLTTLQKACTDTQFNANPAGCPAASLVGTAVAHTPLLNGPLTGPGYLVSHGGAAFPDLVFVLQGEGVVLDLDGNTDIKKGITSETFNSVPDAPITRFETTLPEGPHSVLATNIPASANGSLCGQALTMPTTITGQNGTVIEQATKIAVSGCPKTKTLTRAQKLTIALKVCHKKPKGSKRTSCERQARKKYGPLKKTKKKTTKK
jgi:hypothetical protein